MTQETHAAELLGVSRIYGSGEAQVVALDDVTWRFESGKFTAIMGPSGSGKTTLLQLVAGLTRPSCGQVHLGETRIDDLDERRLAVTRRDRVGFVFQEFNLLPALTALENIILPLRLARQQPDEEWLHSITERAGIADRLDHLPDQLSGGQQQRVALCRALTTRPALVCADEPTGALDSEAGARVMTLLREAVDEYGQTLLLVTHDPIAASYADEVVVLVDGRVSERLVRPTVEWVAATMAARTVQVSRR